MRKEFIENLVRNEQLNYRGQSGSRLVNLTDAVFGIALTLLIFTVSEADSFSDLLIFAKSFPALLMSIMFLFLIWKEHVSFALVYPLHGGILQSLSVLFLALVIFYVYPLRFLTRLLTNLFFRSGIDLNIESTQIPDLMIYYGLVTFALYFVLSLFYFFAFRQKEHTGLSTYEVFFAKWHGYRMLLMALVPLLSVLLSWIFKGSSIVLASVCGGMIYGVYPVLMQIWSKGFKKNELLINEDGNLP